MFNDVARVRNHTGDKNFVLWKLHALPQMIFVFVPRVCCFEAVCPGMNPEHVGHDLIKRSVVDPWSLVNTVTGMKTHLLFWNPAKAFINCFDEHGRTFMPRGRITCRICKDVRQEGIVNLEQQARLNDRLIFRAKRCASGLKELFFSAIVFVGSHTTGRYRRHEYGMSFDCGSSSFEVLDVTLERIGAAVFDWSSTDHRNDRCYSTTAHCFLKILFVVFREGAHFERPAFHWLLRPGFEAFQSFANIGKEAWLG